ncbi:MAG: LOG family protein [Panacagrimonas sp.]
MTDAPAPSKILPKSYLNRDFLMSPEARGVRLLCEYLDPEKRFRELGVQRGVILFGSARLAEESDACRGAADLAELLARWTTQQHALADRYYIVTGGGPGIMQAAHEGAARVDASLNIGLNISLPHEEKPNPFLEPHRALVFHYFFMRKFWFMNLAEAAVIFPGGFGTMDELFELLTLTQTGKSSKMPIVLYDRAFWSETINFESLARRGLIKHSDLDLFSYADTPEEAMKHVLRGLAELSALGTTI